MSVLEPDAASSAEAGDDAANPNRCPKAIGYGEMREHLFRVRAGSASPEDIALQEHIAACDACQETRQELESFEDVLRVHYRDLAPILDPHVHQQQEDAEQPAAPMPDAGLLQLQLTEKLASGIELARTIDELDREYETAFQSRQGRRNYRATCKERLSRVDPDRLSAVREAMISVLGPGQLQKGTKRRLIEDAVGSKYPVEFLLGFSTLKQVEEAAGRVWYLDPVPADPLGIVLDTGSLVPA
jgi:hypothetical protein